MSVDEFYSKLWCPEQGISYSLANSWHNNKRGCISRYFDGKATASNKFMRYGSHVAHLLEKEPDHPLIAHVPKYEYRDVEYIADIHGVKVTCHIDSFDEFPKQRGIEYKTAGKDSSWTQAKVDAHIQIDVYDMVIETLSGKPCADWKLIELPTILTPEDDPVVLLGKDVYRASEVPRLTGEVIVWDRVVAADQRYAAKEWLLSAYYQMKSEYEKRYY